MCNLEEIHKRLHTHTAYYDLLRVNKSEQINNERIDGINCVKSTPSRKGKCQMISVPGDTKHLTSPRDLKR